MPSLLGCLDDFRELGVIWIGWACAPAIAHENATTHTSNAGLPGMRTLPVTELRITLV